jgi:hypothetical protein
MHVGGANVPLANLVGNVYQVEGRIQVELPTPLFVNEERKHLVKVKEVRRSILVAVNILAYIIRVYAIHAIGLSNNPCASSASFIGH